MVSSTDFALGSNHDLNRSSLTSKQKAAFLAELNVELNAENKTKMTNFSKEKDEPLRKFKNIDKSSPIFVNRPVSMRMSKIIDPAKIFNEIFKTKIFKCDANKKYSGEEPLS